MRAVPALAGLVGWMLLAGCAAGPEEPRPDGMMAGDIHTAILLDEALAPLIRLEAQKGYRDPETGAFIAQTLLLNRSMEMVELECRTLFKNDAGVTVEASAWRPVLLTAAGKAVAMAPSLRPEATRFITQIRRK